MEQNPAFGNLPDMTEGAGQQRERRRRWRRVADTDAAAVLHHDMDQDDIGEGDGE